VFKYTGNEEFVAEGVDISEIEADLFWQLMKFDQVDGSSLNLHILMLLRSGVDLSRKFLSGLGWILFVDDSSIFDLLKEFLVLFVRINSIAMFALELEI
jgi:hypothetical protein